jgi:hypothetical protein
MMRTIVGITILLMSVAWSGEAEEGKPLPYKVRTAKKAYDLKIERAQKEFDKKMAEAGKKLNKDLDKAIKLAMKKGNLDEANAIKDEKIEIKSTKSKTKEKKKDNESILLGKWSYTDGKYNTTWVFYKDKTIDMGHQESGTWTITENFVIVTMSNRKGSKVRLINKLHLPLDPKGTKCDDWKFGRNSFTATKLD